MLTLVLGGVRSGKSELAERLASASGGPVLYVATGEPGDPEMAERIARHRQRRPATWRTVEAPDLTAALGPDLAAAGGATILVDGLGGWLCGLMEANGLFTGSDVAPLGPGGRAGHDRVLAAVAGFAAAAATRDAGTVVVADEAGLGGVPLGAASRRFQDLSGEACQLLAAAAGAVWLVVAGLPLVLKGPGKGSGEGKGPGEGPGLANPAGLDALRHHGDREALPGHLDFAVSVVPGGPPAAIRDRLAAALGNVDRYPDDRPARQALARRHGRSPEEVLVLNGAAEAFWLLAGALPPGRAVCIHPSFTEPELALRTRGWAVTRAFRDPQDFTLPAGARDPGAGLVVTGNPNNPTGTLDDAEALAALAAPGRILVVDEAFMDFVPGQEQSLAARTDLPGLVVVRSLTKVWGLAGVRAGYLLGPPDVVATLGAARQPWSVSAPALAVLEAYGNQEVGTRGVAESVEQARRGLAPALARLPGVVVWPSAANFLLMRVPDGRALREGLRQRGIAVRRGDTFPGLTPDHLRVSVRGPADNARLVAALTDLLAGMPPRARRG